MASRRNWTARASEGAGLSVMREAPATLPFITQVPIIKHS